MSRQYPDREHEALPTRSGSVGCAGIGAIVRLLIVLALLLWPAPSFDGYRYAGVPAHAAGLSSLDRIAPVALPAAEGLGAAALSVRAASSPILVAGTDGVAVLPWSPAPAGPHSSGAAVAGGARDRHTPACGRPFLSRAPPPHAGPL